MKLSEAMKDKMLLSFELFPPKTDKGMEIFRAHRTFVQISAGHISCTYGAGGTNVGKNMAFACKMIQDAGTVPVTHFTCIETQQKASRISYRTTWITVWIICWHCAETFHLDGQEQAEILHMQQIW